MEGDNLPTPSSGKEDGNQSYILQINKSAEDILYERFEKMAWGVGSSFVSRNAIPSDNNEDTLQKREAEKDIGVILEATNILYILSESNKQGKSSHIGE